MYVVTQTVDSNLRNALPTPSFDNTTQAICAIGIAAVMAFVHSPQVIHENISIDRAYLDANNWLLVDFGMAGQNSPSPFLYREACDVCAYGRILMIMWNSRKRVALTAEQRLLPNKLLDPDQHEHPRFSDLVANPQLFITPECNMELFIQYLNDVLKIKWTCP